MAPVKSGFYPVYIRESRYSGAYSGGRWVLIAGVRNPERLDAFGSDTNCNAFWMERKENGPVFEAEGLHGDTTAYAAAGNDVNELVEEFKTYGHE